MNAAGHMVEVGGGFAPEATQSSRRERSRRRGSRPSSKPMTQAAPTRSTSRAARACWSSRRTPQTRRRSSATGRVQMERGSDDDDLDPASYEHTCLKEEERWAYSRRPGSGAPTFSSTISASLAGRSSRIAWTSARSAIRQAQHPAEEIIYVLEGTLESPVEGRPPATVNPGGVLFAPADTGPRREERRQRQRRRARHLHRREGEALSAGSRVKAFGLDRATTHMPFLDGATGW